MPILEHPRGVEDSGSKYESSYYFSWSRYRMDPEVFWEPDRLRILGRIEVGYYIPFLVYIGPGVLTNVAASTVRRGVTSVDRCVEQCMTWRQNNGREWSAVWYTESSRKCVCQKNGSGWGWNGAYSSHRLLWFQSQSQRVSGFRGAVY